MAEEAPPLTYTLADNRRETLRLEAELLDLRARVARLEAYLLNPGPVDAPQNEGESHADWTYGEELEAQPDGG